MSVFPKKILFVGDGNQNGYIYMRSQSIKNLVESMDMVDINKLINDVKPKNLIKINNGIAVFENNELKVFFDAIKPNTKLLSQNLHAGTLGFEMSSDKEKIITNCGSVEKRVGKK